MKNSFRLVSLVVAIFSVIGIFIVGYIYIKKNKRLFKALFQNVSEKAEELEKSVSQNNFLDEVKREIEERVDFDKLESAMGTLTSVFPASKKPTKTVTKKLKRPSKKVLKKVVRAINESSSNKSLSVNNLNLRQQQLLDYLRTNLDSKMSNVSAAFSTVTPRTLRRDMEKLESMGFIRQQGKTRDTVYKVM